MDKNPTIAAFGIRIVLVPLSDGNFSSVPLLIDDLSDFGFLPRRINLHIRHDLSRVYAEFHAVCRHGTGNTDIDSAKMNRKSAIPHLKRLVILDIIARKKMKYIPCIKNGVFFKKCVANSIACDSLKLSFVNKSETSLSPARVCETGVAVISAFEQEQNTEPAKITKKIAVLFITIRIKRSD
ncbi:MAG: hypothetical protein ACLSHL_00820 [Alistipes communis]